MVNTEAKYFFLSRPRRFGKYYEKERVHPTINTILEWQEN